MNVHLSFDDSYVSAGPEELVSFSVVCQPSSGSSLDDVRSRLSLKTLREYSPSAQVRAQVVNQLRSLGFEVFEGRSPVVTARGSGRLFESIFGGRLVKRIRRRKSATSQRIRTLTSIVLSPDSPPPSPSRIAGALLVAVAEEPVPTAPSIPPATNGFNLHLPGDIAQLTGASAAHRLSTPLGERATGEGVVVVVVDGGFANHPYYPEHGYRITRVAASDVTSDPAEDDEPHGTCIISGLFACAPDVQLFGIKYGDNTVVALEDAIATPGVKVISLSWGFDLAGKKSLPCAPVDMLPLQLVILYIIQEGVTVVAAAGNGQINFPAMMPDVIAVGGVEIDAADSLAAWNGASSFLSSIFRGRTVPDVCGIASSALLPIPATPADPGPPPVPASPPGWDSLPGGTSLATCQVAGVAALLLQKCPNLTPQALRAALMSTATDVVSGQTASGDSAGAGPDLATGSGLVNAFMAWNSV